VDGPISARLKGSLDKEVGMTRTSSTPEKEPPEDSGETAAGQADKGQQQGITNKPAAEEQRQQEKLPPRGTAKPEE
jgi:hypothetical protein